MGFGIVMLVLGIVLWRPLWFAALPAFFAAVYNLSGRPLKGAKIGSQVSIAIVIIMVLMFLAHRGLEPIANMHSMTKTASKIRFKAKLLRPAEGGFWAFLILPKIASAKLPTRSRKTVDGTINGCPFRATLEPDGQRSHWLKLNKKMAQAQKSVTLSRWKLRRWQRNQNPRCRQICGRL